MDGFLRLPATLLALVLAADIAGASTSSQLSLSKYWNTTDNTQDRGVPPPTPTQPILTTAALLPSTGSGSEYASQCIHALTSFSSKSSAWTSRHQTMSNTTTIVGGPSYTRVTYYEGATTLCDGHPRLTTSPGTSLSEGYLTFPGTGPTSTSTIVNTYGHIYPHESASPTCSVEPSDCDPFWVAYSTKMSEWSALGAAQTTPAPQTPPCMNQSMASSAASFQSSFRGCGLCTIYGQGVELVYFPPPPTVSRDMCASTPVANLTYYEPGAILEAYAGTQYGAMATPKPDAQTAVVGQNTFTSGTAYISISKVWAEDRCSKTKGTPVNNAILAMPSESVLSLRYSQDHFQYAMVTGTQTGFPVSYADFQTPIPWSAWNGQEQCYNSYGGYYCDVIYENKYRPQLAIPPEINMLNDDWKDCQLWYGGLYDPPLALQPAESIAMPTRPGHHQEATSTAEPSSTLAKPTAEPTALADHDPNAQSNNGGGDKHGSSDGDEGADKTRPGDGDEVWNGEEWVPAGNGDDDNGKSGGSHENGLPGPSRPDSHDDGGDAHHDDGHGGAGGTGSSNDDSSDGGSGNGNSGMGGKGETGSNQDGSESKDGESSSHDGSSGQGTSSTDSDQNGSGEHEGSSSDSGSQQENTSNHGSGAAAGENGEEQDSSNDASGSAQSTDDAANGATADADSPQPTTNQVISACEEGVVIDGSTITLATQHPATTVQVNGYSHTIKQLGSGVVEVDGGMVIGAGNDAVTVTPAAGATSGASSQSSGDAAADAIAAGMGMSGPHGGHGGSATSSVAGSSSQASGSSEEDANSGSATKGGDGSQQSGTGSASTASGSSKDNGSSSGSAADASSNSSGQGRTSQQTSSAGDGSASTQQQQTASSSPRGGPDSASSSLTASSGDSTAQQTSTSAPTAAQQTTNAGSRISLLHVHGLVVGIMTFMIAIL
ncbi:hypothetical protein KC330_g2336 [Hortaea werneckii]|nr:hypothetical protein KC330_g2336 [Hortaea werneckii]